MDNTNEPVLTFRDYIRIIFRQKAVVFTCIITMIGATYIGLKLKTPVYQSSVKMLITAEKQVEAPYYRNLLRSQSEEVVLTQSEIVKSNPVLERAVKALRLYARPLDYEKNYCSDLKKMIVDYEVKKMKEELAKMDKRRRKAYLFRMAVEALKKAVKVEPIRDTNMFQIKVRDFSPVGAAIMANVVSRSYVIYDLEQQLAEMKLKYGDKHPSIIQLKESIKKMEKTLNGAPLPNIEAIGPASVKIIEQAQIPIKPEGPPKIIIFLIAVIMSPVLGIMLAFTFEYLDQSIKTPQDIETFFNISCLGSIPKSRWSRREYLQKLTDQIYMIKKDKNIKTILFTSAARKEGVTTITANIAKNISEKTNEKILIIDANLRYPKLHKAFKQSIEPGLSNAIEGKVPIENCIRPIIPKKNGKKTVETNLYFLPAGDSKMNPLALFSTNKLEEIMKELSNLYDIIFIDCSNMKDYKDANLIANYIDSIVFVISEGKTRRQVIESAIAVLGEKKNKIIGAILNRRTFPIPSIFYGRT